jgi:hypothetical protein
MEIFLYRAVVQLVLLYYGSEICQLQQQALIPLQTFHNKGARTITHRHIRGPPKDTTNEEVSDDQHDTDDNEEWTMNCILHLLIIFLQSSKNEFFNIFWCFFPICLHQQCGVTTYINHIYCSE